MVVVSIIALVTRVTDATAVPANEIYDKKKKRTVSPAARE